MLEYFKKSTINLKKKRVASFDVEIPSIAAFGCGRGNDVQQSPHLCYVVSFGKAVLSFLTFLKWSFIFRGFFLPAHILRNMFKVNTSFLYRFFLPSSTVLRPVVLMEWRQFLDFENILNLKINSVKRLQFK